MVTIWDILFILLLIAVGFSGIIPLLFVWDWKMKRDIEADAHWAALVEEEEKKAITAFRQDMI